MPIKNITYDVTVGGDSKDIIRAEINSGYKNFTSKASLEVAEASSSWLGESVSISLGYNGSNTQIFQGYVDDVSYTRMPGTYEITCSDILRLAEKHYIVTNNLDEPWTRENISAENLIRDLLAEAGLTNYSGYSSSFTFGTNGKVEFNLTAVSDAISQICNILATNVYAIGNTVYFRNTRPVPDSSYSKEITKYIQADYTYGTEGLRNKVVVFGKNGIYAEASEESPYLPSGFYQTAIVSSELIDSQSMADDSVEYNLELYNKLTEELKLDIEGDPSINVRDTVKVNNSTLGINENWFVYSVRHNFEDTFTTSLYLRK